MHYGYILRGTVTGLFKVGIAKNTKARFSQYKTHTPERITMEAVKKFVSESEARDWERWIFFEHRESIEHGEWLNLDFGEMAQVWALGMNGADWQTRHRELAMVAVQYRDTEGGFTLRIFRCPGSKVAMGLVEKIDNLNFMAYRAVEQWPRFINAVQDLERG